jgi:thioredoxin-related protein
MRLSRKTRRFLEISANIAIVIVAAVIVGNFVWSRIHPKQNVSGPAVGSAVSLAGVNWKENGSTLLMVLQKGCRYCEESAPFYQKLHENRSGMEPRMLVLVPGEQKETSRYLSDLKIPSDGIVSASLASVNVAATPTLLLIDQTGHIKDVWVGKLDADREKEVTQKVFHPQ